MKINQNNRIVFIQTGIFKFLVQFAIALLIAIVLELVVFDLIYNVEAGFSVARIVAIVVVYLGVVFLTSLQKSPDYKLDNDNWED